MTPATIDVEFVGGPLDGQRRAMPDARAEWRFPQQSLGAVFGFGPGLLDPHEPLVYRRVGHRDTITEHGATRVLLYRLVEATS